MVLSIGASRPADRKQCPQYMYNSLSDEALGAFKSGNAAESRKIAADRKMAVIESNMDAIESESLEGMYITTESSPQSVVIPEASGLTMFFQV